MKNTFRLARLAGTDGQVTTALLLGERRLDLAAAVRAFGAADFQSDMAALLADWQNAFAVIQATVDSLGEDASRFEIKGEARLLPPVPRPGKILCAAANYAAHVAEMAQTGFTGPANAAKGAPVEPKRPYHFLKASSCSTGPEDDIILPSPDHRIDWEVELAAVIGEPAKNVAKEAALAHVAGYVIVNDVSCRAATWREDRPNIRSDWLAGKSYDTFLPTGPYFLPAAFVPDYRELRLQLWVNGQPKQDGKAGDMIFSLEDQIAYLSAMLTLESGDLVATGTPAGVGQGQGSFLMPGDVVEAEIAGLGRQRNTVRL